MRTPAVIPATWPAAVTPAWRVEVGEGYSSPIVAGNRVFVHSRRDPEELVTAVDLHTGKVLWQQKYPAPFAKKPIRGPHGEGAELDAARLGRRGLYPGSHRSGVGVERG